LVAFLLESKVLVLAWREAPYTLAPLQNPFRSVPLGRRTTAASIQRCKKLRWRVDSPFGGRQKYHRNHAISRQRFYGGRLRCSSDSPWSRASVLSGAANLADCPTRKRVGRKPPSTRARETVSARRRNSVSASARVDVHIGRAGDGASRYDSRQS